LANPDTKLRSPGLLQSALFRQVTLLCLLKLQWIAAYLDLRICMTGLSVLLELLSNASLYNDCTLSFTQAIFTAGYKAILHIHSVVEECEIMGLIHQIDPKTKKPIRKKVLFVKNGAVVVVRIQVGIQFSFPLSHGN